ncbi:SIR2 family protein [Weissella confusa]|uniref:SIR2 family protein n=1 Tax=Weissella confusa TaxID=1583 RepID=UPI001C6F6E10|nr:SIR2 family protein [Weissella confusa]QYU56733.1 SIR2 family protein [Weissella confusa]
MENTDEVQEGIDTGLEEKTWFKTVDKKYSVKEGEYLFNGKKFVEDEGPLSNPAPEENRVKFENGIRQEVSDFTHNHYDNVVVLLGAGASVVDNTWQEDEFGNARTGLTVNKIAEKISQVLSNDLSSTEDKADESADELTLLSLREMSAQINYPFELDKDSDLLPKNFNLEDFLSAAFAYSRFVNTAISEQFNNTLKEILSIIIRSTSYDYNSKDFNHIAFLNAVSDLVSEETKLNVITTNYDTLIEDAAETMNWTIFDGFSFSRNPRFDSTMFDWSLTKKVPYVKTSEMVYKRHVLNLIKIHGSINWEKSESGDIMRKAKKGGDKPVLVFPSSNKYAQTYEEPYFDLFAKFQNLLKEPNTLLITAGFSFADNHISRIIESNVRTNESFGLLVTDFSIEANNDNWNNLEQLMHERYRIAFRSRHYDWSRKCLK